jgi:elongation factor P
MEGAMVIAANLRPGAVLRLDGGLWRVVSVDVSGGTGQMKGTVHARLLNVVTHHDTDRRFRPEERLEEEEISVRPLTYSYRQGNSHVFMDPESYDQVPVPEKLLGPFLPFLKEEVEILVEFFEETPVGCRFPDSVELRVSSTAPPMHRAEANVWKEAVLENGLEVQVPLFIETGETIRIDVRTRRYMERVRK